MWLASVLNGEAGGRDFSVSGVGKVWTWHGEADGELNKISGGVGEKIVDWLKNQTYLE
jgi:hypothetical protein